MKYWSKHKAKKVYADTNLSTKFLRKWFKRNVNRLLPSKRQSEILKYHETLGTTMSMESMFSYSPSTFTEDAYLESALGEPDHDAVVAYAIFNDIFDIHQGSSTARNWIVVPECKIPTYVKYRPKDVEVLQVTIRAEGKPVDYEYYLTQSPEILLERLAYFTTDVLSFTSIGNIAAYPDMTVFKTDTDLLNLLSLNPIRTTEECLECLDRDD